MDFISYLHLILLISDQTFEVTDSAGKNLGTSQSKIHGKIWETMPCLDA